MHFEMGIPIRCVSCIFGATATVYRGGGRIVPTLFSYPRFLALLPMVPFPLGENQSVGVKSMV